MGGFLDSGKYVTLGYVACIQAETCYFILKCYTPTAYALARTLRKQAKHLQRSFDNLDVLDALVTQEAEISNNDPASPTSPTSPTSRFARSQSTSGSNAAISATMDSKAQGNDHSRTPFKAPSTPSPAILKETKYPPPSNSYFEVQLPSLTCDFRSPPHRASRQAEPIISSRTAIQKGEILEKLRSTNRMKEIIMYQLIATSVMLVVYTAVLSESDKFSSSRFLLGNMIDVVMHLIFFGVVVFSLRPGFEHLDSITAQKSMPSLFRMLLNLA